MSVNTFSCPDCGFGPPPSDVCVRCESAMRRVDSYFCANCAREMDFEGQEDSRLFEYEYKEEQATKGEGFSREMKKHTTTKERERFLDDLPYDPEIEG